MVSTPSMWGESSSCHILQLEKGGRSSLLLPAADDFENQCLLSFRPCNWPVAQISKQRLSSAQSQQGLSRRTSASKKTLGYWKHSHDYDGRTVYEM